MSRGGVVTRDQCLDIKRVDVAGDGNLSVKSKEERGRLQEQEVRWRLQEQRKEVRWRLQEQKKEERWRLRDREREERWRLRDREKTDLSDLQCREREERWKLQDLKKEERWKLQDLEKKEQWRLQDLEREERWRLRDREREERWRLQDLKKEERQKLQNLKKEERQKLQEIKRIKKEKRKEEQYWLKRSHEALGDEIKEEDITIPVIVSILSVEEREQNRELLVESLYEKEKLRKIEASRECKFRRLELIKKESTIKKDTNVCKILQSHVEELKFDPERLSTDFIRKIAGIKDCEEVEL